MFGRTPKDRPCIYSWAPPRRFFDLRPRVNVGDRLALDLVERIIAGRGMELSDYKAQPRRLFCVGSVMRLVRERDVVWGSGINGKTLDQFRPVEGMDIRAVRGPLTAAVLRAAGLVVPSVFGDPGILADRYFPMKPTGEQDYWVVPHFRESANLYLGRPLLSPAQIPERFLRKLTRARRVVSSSLHGLVLAEAYGIPAVPLRNPSGEHPFKYQDYYEGTGREFPGFSESVEAALRCEPPPGIPDGVKDRLLDVFPWDLWRAPGSI